MLFILCTYFTVSLPRLACRLNHFRQTDLGPDSDAKFWSLEKSFEKSFEYFSNSFVKEVFKGLFKGPKLCTVIGTQDKALCVSLFNVVDSRRNVAL